MRVGCLTVRRDADGHHVIWADASELQRLARTPSVATDWAKKGRFAELKSRNAVRSVD